MAQFCLGTLSKEMDSDMDVKTATAEDLMARQRLLESEIDANENETLQFQAELNQIYAEQDRRRGRKIPESPLPNGHDLRD